MEQPFDPVERQLLAQVANGIDDARDLLAAHWAVHGEPARGELLRVQDELAGHPTDRRLRADERRLLERHGERWLAPAVAAGFEREHLGFARGFLCVALVVTGEPTDALLRLSPVVYRELGRADCNGRVFAASVVTAGGEADRVLLKTVDPHWPDVVYDEDIRYPSEINRMAMRGYAVRREDAPMLALVLRGGVHLSSVLGVRARSDPESGRRPRGRRLGLAFALAVTRAACSALAAMHAADAVHGSITPENILLGAHGGVHLLDVYPHRSLFDTFMPWAVEQRWHVSPEQTMGNARSARDDVFTLALVMCTLIDGEHPLAGHDDLFDRFVALRNRQLALPTHLPAAIDHVLRVALAERAYCYPHAGAFGDALAQAADHAGIPYGPSVIAAMLGSLPPLPPVAHRGGSR